MSAATRCGTKGCPNEATEKVPDEKLPHVVYDLCASCAAGMRALEGVELIDARNVPPLTFTPIAATTLAVLGWVIAWVLWLIVIPSLVWGWPL